MIATRLTAFFGLTVPLISAPMAGAGGGVLAGAVTQAGGLGLIGGGYGDAGWIAAQFEAAGPRGVGAGFIAWSLTEAALDAALARNPRAILLSFGDPAPWAARLGDVPLICQVQDIAAARRAIDAGAAVIVAQGSEAGGHGATRATMTLVPELADLLAREAPQVIPVAAGGIADGRGLAAALMLGAEGVLVGSRLWASAEALVPETMQAAGVAADGDATLRTRVPDIARGLDWPQGYSIRVQRNGFTDRWADDEAGLRGDAHATAAWRAAAVAGDPAIANPIIGEAAGLIHAVEPAGTIVARIGREAEALLAGGWRRC